MDAKHAPGPWIVYQYAAIDADGEDAETAIQAYADENGENGATVARVNRWSYGDDPPTEESQANARLIAAAPEFFELASAPLWLVWSNQHAAWWGPGRCGYYWSVEHAGRYTLEEALKITGERLVARGDGINPPELIQPSPEWLALRNAVLAKAKGGA